MSKIIVLIRHGKASHDSFFIKDIERPLIEKGVDRTKKISKYLLDGNIIPELLISSSAVRAFETAKVVASEFNYNEKKIILFESLYGCDISEYLKIIHSLENKINTVFIFGHNPGISECYSYLNRNSQVTLPTSGTVVLTSSSKKWISISPENTKLAKLFSPKKPLQKCQNILNT